MYAVSDTVEVIETGEVGQVVAVSEGLSGLQWVIVNTPDYPDGLPWLDSQLRPA